VPPRTACAGPGLSWVQLIKEIQMPVILWLLGVPLSLILLFMLIF
jgi:hypothetical protein